MLAARRRSAGHSATGRATPARSELALHALSGGELIEADNGGFFSIASTIVLVAAEHEQAMPAWEHARTDAHRRGSLFAAGAINLWHGYTIYRRGELADAQEELEAALVEFEGWGAGAGAHAYVRTFLAHTHLERGDVAAARQVHKLRPVDPAADITRFWLVARLALEVREGRAEEALATARQIADGYPGVQNVVFNPWRSLAAEAHHQLGQREEAVTLRRRRWRSPGGGAHQASWVAPSVPRDPEARGGDGAPARGGRAARGLPGPARAGEGSGGLGAALRRDRRPSDAASRSAAHSSSPTRVARPGSPRTSAPSSTRPARGRAQRRRPASAR